MPARPPAAIAPRVRLPPLQYLRVKNPDKSIQNPCMNMMSAVLACWAAGGYSVTGCTEVEMQLRRCMDSPDATKKGKSTINYHLKRLYPQLKGPHKKN